MRILSLSLLLAVFLTGCGGGSSSSSSSEEPGNNEGPAKEVATTNWDESNWDALNWQ